MNDPVIITHSHDATILAHGTASRWGQLRNPVVLGIGLLLFACLGIPAYWWGFRQPFSIPQQTALLISVRPSQLSSLLTSTQHDALPAPWKNTLRTTSSWRVILGASHQEGVWQTFVIKPRWLVQDGEIVQERKGLFALVDAVHQESTSTRLISYTQQGAWQTTWMRPLFSFWINPQMLFPDATAQVSSLEPFTGSFRHNLLLTSLRFAQEKPATPIKQVDLSLALNQDPIALSLVRGLRLQQAILPSLNVTSTQINLILDPIGMSIDTVQIQFPTPLTPMEAKRLLAELHVRSRRVIQLNDGTLAHEERLLESDESVFGFRTSTRYGAIDLQPTELRLGQTTATLSDSLVQCDDVIPWAFLSSQFVRLLSPGGLQNTFSSFPSFSIGSYRNRLAACVRFDYPQRVDN